MPDLAQFGASGAVVVVVYFFLRFMREEAKKRDETYGQVAAALTVLNKSVIENTSATTSADTYLKQRNGRDIEKHAELLKATKAIPITLKKIAQKQATEIIKAVKVERQYIEHADIGKQTVKK